MVDFGSIQLVSGFQSQGPPKSLHPKEYLRYVGLEIEHSLDGIKWEHCCDDHRNTVSFDSIIQDNYNY